MISERAPYTSSVSKVEKFEDLVVWQKARKLVRSVYGLTADQRFRHDYNLRDQLRRATVSVLANIAEGFERGSQKEFGRFLSIARGSCAEVKAVAYVALDQNYVTEPQFDSLYAQCSEIGRLLNGLKRSLVDRKRH